MSDHDPIPTTPTRRRRTSAAHAPPAPEPTPAAPAPAPVSADSWGLTPPGASPDLDDVPFGEGLLPDVLVDVPGALPEPEATPRRTRGRAAALATSAALARELDTSAREAGIVQSAQTMRGDASPFGALPEPGPGYDRITTRIFDLPDPDAEYRDLEATLRLGTQAFDSISAALDGAEDNARRAHRLYVCARVDAERFNIDADCIEAAMRTQAIGELQREKDQGVRTKTITEADTTGKVAAMFPDEHRDLADRKVKSRKMVEHLEAFAGLWRSRCYSLSKMLESKR